MRVIPKVIVLIGVVFATGNCRGQAEQAAKPAPKADQQGNFRLDFVLKETENGKQVNLRTFTMNSAGGNCNVRSGEKMPVSGSKGDGSYTYLDVGVNLDCRVLNEKEGQLYLTVTADITSAATTPPAGMAPVIHSLRWGSTVVVPLRKATVLYLSDDTVLKHQTQLELTATPIP